MLDDKLAAASWEAASADCVVAQMHLFLSECLSGNYQVKYRTMSLLWLLQVTGALISGFCVIIGYVGLFLSQECIYCLIRVLSPNLMCVEKCKIYTTDDMSEYL